MLRRSFLTRTLAVSAGAAFGPTPALAQAPAAAIPDTAPASGRYVYRATRGGSEIGGYTAELARSGDQITATAITEIAVKVAFITAYRFTQRTSEVMKANRLVSYEAATDDDGKKNTVQAKASGSTLDLSINGQVARLPPTLIPASLWNPRLLQQSQLFNTDDGKLLNINVRQVAEESLPVLGRAARARKFAITGDLVRDIWYDDKWTPVQVSFRADRDKSEIKLILQSA